MSEKPALYRLGPDVVLLPAQSTALSTYAPPPPYLPEARVPPIVLRVVTNIQPLEKLKGDSGT